MKVQEWTSNLIITEKKEIISDTDFTDVLVV